MERERGEAVKGGVEFVPKFRLPEVRDYRKDPGSEFWDGFPANRTRLAKSAGLFLGVRAAGGPAVTGG